MSFRCEACLAITRDKSPKGSIGPLGAKTPDSSLCAGALRAVSLTVGDNTLKWQSTLDR
jgi:hypothetical protein